MVSPIHHGIIFWSHGGFISGRNLAPFSCWISTLGKKIRKFRQGIQDFWQGIQDFWQGIQVFYKVFKFFGKVFKFFGKVPKFLGKAFKFFSNVFKFMARYSKFLARYSRFWPDILVFWQDIHLVWKCGLKQLEIPKLEFMERSCPASKGIKVSWQCIQVLAKNYNLSQKKLE